MIEFVRYKRTVCQRCGTRHEEWVDEHGVPLQDPPYVAIHHRCHGCATRAAASNSRTKHDDQAVTTLLVPWHVAAALERQAAPPDDFEE